MREVLVEDFTGIATGALAQPDGVVEAVASDDADRREKAEGAAYEGDGGAGHYCEMILRFLMAQSRAFAANWSAMRLR
mgnify:CR=1 FL=1